MAQRNFGSREATGRKLDVIENYLKMYQKALSGRFDTLYVDAFAGSGEVPLSSPDSTSLFKDEAERAVIVGSAARAMAVEPAFKEFVFIDKRDACLRSLKRSLCASPNLGSAKFIHGDANEQVQRICQSTDWRGKRGVVFLDPFGNQVSWETIEVIAQTEALDMWYLFPAGLGVFRQIGRDGRIDPTHAPSLDRMFGTNDWRTAFVKRTQTPDLFSHKETVEKVVTPASAAEFMMERLRSIFKGGVLEEKIPLGALSYTSYYLLFAWGNKADAAKALASKLSKAALKATDRMYGRPNRN